MSLRQSLVFSVLAPLFATSAIAAGQDAAPAKTETPRTVLICSQSNQRTIIAHLNNKGRIDENGQSNNPVYVFRSGQTVDKRGDIEQGFEGKDLVIFVKGEPAAMIAKYRHGTQERFVELCDDEDIAEKLSAGTRVARAFTP